MTQQEMSKEYPYGAVRAASKSPEARLIAIEASITGHYADGRKITVGELEGNQGYLLAVDNTDQSKDSPYRNSQHMWLTEKSLIGLFNAVKTYMDLRGYDMEQMLANATEGEKAKFSVTPNIEQSLSDNPAPEEQA